MAEETTMAIFIFIFAALCGIITSLLGLMLFDIGLLGGIAVFFVTCYSIALLPILFDAKEH